MSRGLAVGNATTDLRRRYQGSGWLSRSLRLLHTLLAANMHGFPSRAPWEIDIMVAPPWLLDEIERLIMDHGGGKGQPHSALASGPASTASSAPLSAPSQMAASGICATSQWAAMTATGSRPPYLPARPR